MGHFNALKIIFDHGDFLWSWFRDLSSVIFGLVRSANIHEKKCNISDNLWTYFMYCSFNVVFYSFSLSLWNRNWNCIPSLSKMHIRNDPCRKQTHSFDKIEDILRYRLFFHLCNGLVFALKPQLATSPVCDQFAWYLRSLRDRYKWKIKFEVFVV